MKPRNLTSKHDHNKGGQHTSAKDYSRKDGGVDIYKAMDDIDSSLSKIDSIFDEAKKDDPEFYRELCKLGRAF